MIIEFAIVTLLTFGAIGCVSLLQFRARRYWRQR